MQKKYLEKYPAAHTMRSLLPINIKHKKVLDIGCGSGIDSKYIFDQGAIISGIDISSDLITITKESLPEADFKQSDFNYLPWKNNYFDIIWSKYALQHAENISIPLQEVYRVMKKGGTALIQVTHPMRSVQYLPSKNYFEKGIINYPTTDKNIINEYHHTLEDWFQNIIQTGFKIDNFTEIINRPIHEYRGPISPSAIIFILRK